jgi:ATP-binding cassette subfamily C protein LapB
VSEHQEPFLPGTGLGDEAVHGLADDPLAQALVWLTRHHGQPRSAASLLEGQQIDGALGPEQALRALKEAGFNAGLIQRPIADIHTLLLPAVLLLRNGDACVLAGRQGSHCSIVLPGPQAQQLQASEAELGAEYLGFALVATPVAVDRSTRQAGEPVPDPRGHWLWGTVRRFLPYYRSALVAALLSNLLMLVTGLVTGVIYDKVIPHQAMTTLWALASVSVVALIFDLTARQLRAYLIDMAGKKTDLLVGAALFRQSLGVRMEHRPDSSGAYAHIVSQVEMVREFFSSASLAAVSDLPFILVFVAMVFLVAGPLGWVLVLAIPLILGLTLAMQGALRRSTSDNMRQHADLHGLLVEAVDGLEDLKAAGAQGRFIHRYEEATSMAASTAMRSKRISSLATNISGSMQQVVTLTMLVWGVHLIQDHVISSGSLLGAVMFAMRAVAPLANVVSLAMRYQSARAAMKALDKVMAQPLERDTGRSYVPMPQASGRIALHDVGFAYPAHDGQQAPQVLKAINLRFEAGERVAVLGRIGSGKSTVLRLLAGLYQPTQGMVEVDGIDLRQIDPADFRASVGFVAQDPRLFNATLRDNVLLGRPAADPSRLAEAAQLTGLARVVAGHPMGWDLPVGEAGSLLSGGQRQLVALTRSLITKPRILLMDEPTSSMDAQSEVAFLRQLKQASADCTLVMVTHRPAVLELVSRVIVVDAGRVVMDGPKAAVLAALSGAKPAQPAQPAQANGKPAAPSNLHMHPSARPVDKEAAV